jgi:nucleoside phosphorylase
MSNTNNTTEDKVTSGPVDFAIVTALKVERDAVLRRLDTYDQIQVEGDPHTYYYGYVSIPGTGERYTIVVVMLLGQGNEEASATTRGLTIRWQPQSVIMVGIAGGVLRKVKLGDVVVADFVYYFGASKLKPEPEADERRSRHFLSDRMLYGRALAYEASEWKGEIGEERPGRRSPQMSLPDAHFGAIGSSNDIITDPAVIAQLLTECPKLLAVATEGSGVARAAGQQDPTPRFLEVRSISDMADRNKGDKWHPYAANAAAAFVIGLLRTKPVPPLPTGRSSLHEDAPPLLILRAQSLREIAPEEILGAFDGELKGREIETVALDFTDLVTKENILNDPEEAARRLTDLQGSLFTALARSSEAELVFHGLAHIPLAVLAGYLITDRQKVHLFDFHPDMDTWAWPGSDPVFPPLEVCGLPDKRIRSAGDAVVRVSTSYMAMPAQTRAVVPHASVEVDLTVPEIKRDIIRSEEQVRSYGHVLRRTLDVLAQHLPNNGRIHLFYAGPMALAFHLGQQISANIHPPVTAWNYRRGSYEWGIDLAAAAMGETCLVRPPIAP